MSAQHPPGPSQPYGPPHHPGTEGPVPPEAWAQHPAPPHARRMHAGAIIGIILGGMLLLGMTFAGGAAVGWWVGAHHGAMWSPQGHMYPGEPGAPHWDERHHPGQSDGEEQPDS